MIIGPKYKICRRLGSGVFDKCQTQKFMVSEGKKAKTQKGGRRKQLSEYGQQLNEKQKIRFSYGVSEKQLGNYVEEATSAKGAVAADKLFEFLESRLDNVIYRAGFAVSRRLARQMASHGHFRVNDNKTNVPSFRIKVGDTITLKEKSKSSALFQELSKKLEKFPTPTWMTVNADKAEIVIKGIPKKDDAFLDFNTVLEFYSR